MFDMISANVMQLGKADIAVLMIFGLGAYSYTAWIFRKQPDPLAQYLSINTFLACVFGIATGVFTVVLIAIFGRVGYAISIIISPFLLAKAVKKISGE